jgi:hypothetical protein
MERPMQKLNDLSRSPSPLDPDGTLIQRLMSDSCQPVPLVLILS